MNVGPGVEPSVNGKEVFEQTRSFIRRFIAFPDHEAVAVALWAMMAHSTDAFDCVPYLLITGEKGTGKTRLLQVLKLLVPRPYCTERCPPITLAQEIEEREVTLLFDEVDAVFTGRSASTETLRSILNAGYQRGGSITTRENGRPRSYEVFGPKVLAWKGDTARFPETIAHRSIPTTMLRKGPGDHVERFREIKVRPEADNLRGRLKIWGDSFENNGREPEGLNRFSDRAADICEPLLQIAETCGEEVAAAAQEALYALCNPERHEEPSPGVEMLQRIHEIFERELPNISFFDDNPGLRRLRSDTLARRLGITPKHLAVKLAVYGIRQTPMRFGHQSGVGGFLYSTFEPVWERYGIK